MEQDKVIIPLIRELKGLPTYSGKDALNTEQHCFVQLGRIRLEINRPPKEEEVTPNKGEKK